MNKKFIAMMSALSLCVTVSACSKTNTKKSENTTSINIESLEVGDFVFEDVKCQNSKGRLINIPDIVRNVIFYNNTIGIEFFKDKIVQFDFENNLFYVK